MKYLKRLPLRYTKLFVLVTAIILYNFFFDKLLLIAYIPSILLLILFFLILPARIYKLKLSLVRVLLIAFGTIFIFYSYFIIQFFDADINLPTQKLSDVFIKQQVFLIKSLLNSGIFIIFFYYSSYMYGFLLNLKDIEKTSEIIYLRTICGSALIGLLLFVFGSWNVLNIYSILLVLLFPIILLYRNIGSHLDYIRRIAHTVFTLKLNRYKLISCILILSLFAISVVGSIKDYPVGTDAYRAKLNIVKYIAENQQLPSTDIRAIVPFLGEILLSPSYIFGGKPLANLFLFSFFIIAAVGLWYLLKSEKLSRFDIFFIISISLFTPLNLSFIIFQFKIEPVLVSFGVAQFLLLKKYLETKSTVYFKLLIFITSIVFLVKVLSFFWSLPIILIAFGVLIKKHRLKMELIKKALVILFIGIIPVILYLILYRTRLPLIGVIGIGISPQAQNFPLEKLSDPSCNIDLPYLELEQIYKFKSPNYILTPFYSAWYLITHNKRDTSHFHMIRITYLGILTCLFIVLKFKNLKSSFWYRSLAFISIISFLFFYALSPIYLWYILPLLIVCAAFLIKEMWLFNKKEIPTIFLIHLCALMTLSIIMVNTVFHPYSESVTFSHNGWMSSIPSGFIEESYLLGKHLPFTYDGNILVSDSYYGVNIPYFNKYFFDQTIYYDLLGDEYKNENFEGLFNKLGIGYVIINKQVKNNPIQCVKTNQIEFEDNFNQLLSNTQLTVTNEFESKYYILYSIK